MNGCAAAAAGRAAARARSLPRCAPRAETGEAPRQGGERRGLGWDRAAVGPGDRVLQGGARHVAHGAHHGPHRRMGGLDITGRIAALRAGQADEAGMLSRAIVVQGVGLVPGTCARALRPTFGGSARGPRIPGSRRPGRLWRACRTPRRYGPAPRHARTRRARSPRRSARIGPPHRIRGGAAPGTPSPPSAGRPGWRCRRSPGPRRRPHRRPPPHRSAGFPPACRAAPRRGRDCSFISPWASGRLIRAGALVL